MNPASDNPYDILGVSETASPREIRAAYRRAALEHHPDRAGPGSKETFTKISHAYEVLTDPEQARDFTSRTQQQQQQQQQRSSYQHSHPSFHDPFAVFESVFRDEFGPDFFHGRGGSGGSMLDSFFRSDPFLSDPFFSSPFGMMGGRHDQVSQQRQPRSSFFSEPLFGDAFFDNLQQQAQKNGGGNFYSSTTTVSSRRGDGEWVTETHRNHNGQTVHETVKMRPDGTVVERKVEGNEDLLQGRRNMAVEDGAVSTTAETVKHTNAGKRFRLPWGRGGSGEDGGEEATA